MFVVLSCASDCVRYDTDVESIMWMARQAEDWLLVAVADTREEAEAIATLYCKGLDRLPLGEPPDVVVVGGDPDGWREVAL